MIGQYLTRLQLVKRILDAMDCEFATDEDGSLWVNDGQYQIFLPDRPASEIIIRFSKNLHPAVVAGIATRFAGVATPMGLDVSFAGSFDPNDGSTGVVLIQ